jgi:hypothetical protein
MTYTEKIEKERIESLCRNFYNENPFYFEEDLAKSTMDDNLSNGRLHTKFNGRILATFKLEDL